MNAAPQTTRWAQYLAQAQALTPPASTGPARGPALTAAEAARVQRHRDQLMAALRSQDRLALHCAKQCWTQPFAPTVPRRTTATEGLQAALQIRPPCAGRCATWRGAQRPCCCRVARSSEGVPGPCAGPWGTVFSKNGW